MLFIYLFFYLFIHKFKLVYVYICTILTQTLVTVSMHFRIAMNGCMRIEASNRERMGRMPTLRLFRLLP